MRRDEPEDREDPDGRGRGEPTGNHCEVHTRRGRCLPLERSRVAAQEHAKALRELDRRRVEAFDLLMAGHSVEDTAAALGVTARAVAHLMGC